MGAVASNWGDVPVVLRDKPWPTLVRTGSVMTRYGATLGLVGFTYSAVECAAETVRGTKDWKNGVFGGAAAGAALGLRIGHLKPAVAAAATFAVVSMAVDFSGGRLIGQGLNDGATPRRRLFPYNT